MPLLAMHMMPMHGKPDIWYHNVSSETLSLDNIAAYNGYNAFVDEPV